MDKRKIVIVNAHWSNRGDEAALRALINGIYAVEKACEITVIFKDANNVQQFPYKDIRYFSSKFLPSGIWETYMGVVSKGCSRMVKTKGLNDCVKALCDADLIIYSPGGAVISDRFWWRKQQEYLLPIMCAKHYQIPMVFAAPSIGPFEGKVWRNMIRKRYLDSVDALCVREEISKEYLSQINVKKNVITTIDTAFYDMPNMIENSRQLETYSELNAFLGQYAKVVGITITDFKWHVKYGKDDELRLQINNAMKCFISKMKEQNIGVLLIPQLFGNQNDREYLKEFEADNTFLMEDLLDTYFQQYIISQIYAVVGMRYHSNIFAAKMGTPFLAIAYEEKMSGFMEMAQLEQYLVRLENLSSDVLLECWNRLESNYEGYKELLAEQHSCWQEKAATTIEQVKEVLESTKA